MIKKLCQPEYLSFSNLNSLVFFFLVFIPPELSYGWPMYFLRHGKQQQK